MGIGGEGSQLIYKLQNIEGTLKFQNVLGDTALEIGQDKRVTIHSLLTLPTSGISGAGDGSGLDADTVDGKNADELLTAAVGFGSI